MRVVATAGHVDHGKSALVRALTGVEPDRWREERARGMTIDLGFAAMPFPEGGGIAFVDVPGHVHFLKNMLAGAGAVDLCLFVVAANEGWKPQSEEHLRLLDLLGYRGGVVALTKSDLVDDACADDAARDVTARLAGTFLDGAPTVRVDALTGTGIEAVRRELERLVKLAPRASDRGRPRLWVDRAFVVHGAGTVVTGTLGEGVLRVGAEVVVAPGGSRARVRALQSHGRDVTVARPGTRVAANLAGVAVSAVPRGSAVVEPGRWHPTSAFDGSISTLVAGPGLGRRGAWHLHVGAGAHPVRVRVLGADAIVPGSQGLVRVHLPVAVPLAPGDRFVLRDDGRDTTVGGGEVLDVAPVLPAAQARPDRSVDRVVAERGWVDADLLERLTGERRDPQVGRFVVDTAALERARRSLLEAVDEGGRAGIETEGLDERTRAVAETMAELTIEYGRLRRAGSRLDADQSGYLQQLRSGGFAPPPPTGVDAAELRRLRERGLAQEYDGVWFATEAVAHAARLIAALMQDGPDGITVAAARDVLGVSRKYALPLLGLLDRNGFTRRRGDLRVAGPRLPETPSSPAPRGGR